VEAMARKGGTEILRPVNLSCEMFEALSR